MDEYKPKLSSPLSGFGTKQLHSVLVQSSYGEYWSKRINNLITMCYGPHEAAGKSVKFEFRSGLIQVTGCLERGCIENASRSTWLNRPIPVRLVRCRGERD